LLLSVVSVAPSSPRVISSRLSVAASELSLLPTSSFSSSLRIPSTFFATSSRWRYALASAWLRQTVASRPLIFCW
jgi:hypothetical protein